MKHSKFLHSLLFLPVLMAIILSQGCTEDINDVMPPETATGKVKFSFTREHVFLEPDLMVLNMNTPRGDIENARVFLEKQGNKYLTNDDFSLIPGDYILNSWIAYDENLQSTVTSTGEAIPFTVSAEGQAIEVESPSENIPYDRFSKINSFYAKADISDIAVIGDGEIVMAGVTGSVYSSNWRFDRMTTKGDMLWGAEHTDSKAFANHKITVLTDQTIVGMAYAAYGPAYRIMPPVNLDIMARGVSGEDGSELFTVDMSKLLGWHPAYEYSTLYIYLPQDIRATPDGGFVVFAQAFLVNGTVRPFTLVKFDNNGNREWGKVINFPAQVKISRQYAYLREVAVNNNGNINVVGSINSYPYVARFSSAGDSLPVFDLSIVANPESRINSSYHRAAPTSDNGLIISTASANGKALLVKIDENGEFEWKKEFTENDNTYSNSNRAAVNMGADGSIIFADTYVGESSNNSNAKYIKIYRLDNDGNILMESGPETIGSSIDASKSGNYVHIIHETNNSNVKMRGIVIQGYYATGGNDVGWIIKIPSASMEVTEKTNSPTEFVFQE